MPLYYYSTSCACNRFCFWNITKTTGSLIIVFPLLFLNGTKNPVVIDHKKRYSFINLSNSRSEKTPKVCSQ